MRYIMQFRWIRNPKISLRRQETTSRLLPRRHMRKEQQATEKSGKDVCPLYLPGRRSHNYKWKRYSKFLFNLAIL